MNPDETVAIKWASIARPCGFLSPLREQWLVKQALCRACFYPVEGLSQDRCIIAGSCNPVEDFTQRVAYCQSNCQLRRVAGGKLSRSGVAYPSLPLSSLNNFPLWLSP